MGTSEANKKYNLKKKQEKIDKTFILSDGETWKIIDGNEKYRITNKGRIFSTSTCTFLTPHIGKNGYMTVRMTDRKTKTIHRIIAENFIENPYNLPFVDHIDRNRLNNNLENLRWVSIQQNAENKTKKGSIYINTCIKDGKEYKYVKASWCPEVKKYKHKNFKTYEEAEKFLKDVEYKYNI